MVGKAWLDMSRKLATTIKDSAIPGKYKRVLEAYAAFANNDGTNIRPSQTQLGSKAGTSRWTFSRNTGDLIESGVLRRAQSHTCKVSSCNKGSTHFTGTWGRYTLVYEIDISQLQNAERYLGAKQQKVNVAKCQKVMGAKCYTTQALPLTPAALGITEDSSALTSVRKEGRKASAFELESEPKPALGNDEIKVSEAWVKNGGRGFLNGDAEAATRLLGVHDLKVLLGYIEDTFKAPKTSKVAWRDFSYWADSMSVDAEPSTKRNIDAWRRATAVKPLSTNPGFTNSAGTDWAAHYGKMKNPNCTRCKGPTYGNPTYEEDKPYCADCMKKPEYRRHSGERQILKGDI
jgi:hypothetical protein